LPVRTTEHDAALLAERVLRRVLRLYDAIVSMGLAFAREATVVGAASPIARQASPAFRAQSPDPFARLQIRRFAFPIGLRRAFHQQSGRARHPHDEGQNENLGRFPRPGRRRNLCNPQLRHLHSPKTRLGHLQKPSQPLHPNSFSPYPSNKGLGVTSNKGLEVT
jgi:hypothetical protein